MSVEKYIINKESSNFTIIPNKVIQGLKDQLELLGFYLYLLSLPPNWSFHKNNLKDTCGIGVKKLETMLSKLAQYNLIHVAQMRNEKGQFAHFDITVYNGESFKINNLQNAQPCINNRTSENGSTVKNTYKRNINKNINKDKENIFCALEKNAHSRFDDFWFVYPRKKDKKRSHSIWIKNKLDEKADEIINDVKDRLNNDSSWNEIQYIPHPSTYLKFERWRDEVVLKEIKSKEKFNAHQYAIDRVMNTQAKKKGIII